MVSFKIVQCYSSLTYVFHLWHLVILELRAEHQSVRMSEINNVG